MAIQLVMRSIALALLFLGCGGEVEAEPAGCAPHDVIENPPGPGCMYLNVDGDAARFSVDEGACGGPACLNVPQGQPVYVLAPADSRVVWYEETGDCAELPQCVR